MALSRDERPSWRAVVSRAVGGALLSPAALALVLAAFPINQRTLAVSLWGAVVGLLDFVNAFAQGLRADIAAQDALGPGWFIPAFAVAHLLVVRLLLTRGRAYTAPRPPAGVVAQLEG